MKFRGAVGHMDMLTTREVAVLFWLLVVLLVGFRSSNVRWSFANLLRSFFRWKIITTVAAMLLYICGVVMVLWRVNLWAPALLKDTLFWFISGLGYIMRFVTRRGNDDKIIREMIRASIKSIVVLEFLLNTYTFSLLVELLLVPFVILLYLIKVTAEVEAQRENRYVLTAKFINNVQAVVGCIIIASVIVRAVSDMENLTSLPVLRQIFLPALLTFMFIPFIYGTVLWSRLELLFVTTLGQNPYLTKGLKYHTILRIVCYCRLRISRVNLIWRMYGFRLRQVKNRDQIDALFSELRSYLCNSMM